MLTSVVLPILDSSSTEHGCLTHLSQSSPLHSMRSVPLFQLGLLCIFLKRFRRFLFRWPFKDYRSLVCYDFILDLGQWTEHESRPKPDLMCHHPSIQSISGWKLHHKLSRCSPVPSSVNVDIDCEVRLQTRTMSVYIPNHVCHLNHISVNCDWVK